VVLFAPKLCHRLACLLFVPVVREVTQLSEYKQFHNLLGIRSRKRSKLYREMGDVELVLRFFAFRETWHDFAGGITRHLDTYMENNKNMEKARIDEAKTDFLKTLDIVDMIFGQGAYRRWIPETGKWRNQVLAALFDAQMLSFREFSIEEIEPHSDIILERFKQLFGNDEFQRAIGASISVYFRRRIEMVRDIIRETI